MKKLLLLLIVCVVILPSSKAQDPTLEVIKTAVKKVLNGIDLQVQRLQNKTIWLQNAQKELENIMSKLKLDEITGWVEKQRKLYADYYNELWQVKVIIADYEKVKRIIQLQTRIVSEYKYAYGLFKQDKHFSKAELDYMYKVYSGILDESLKNADQVLLVVNSFVTQMSDAQRVKIINEAAGGMEKNYNDLKQFNNQNILLSVQRGIEGNDVEIVKKLYGLR